MRIVEVGKYYPPVAGGIENNTRQCCLELAEDHDVHALVSQKTSSMTVEERVQGIPVTRVGNWRTVAGQPLSPALPYHLRRLRPDLVHLHTPNPLAVLAYLLATPRTPLVITHHTDIVRQSYLKHLVLPPYRYVLRRAEAVITYTQHYARTSPELARVQGKNVVIPHGTEEALFEKTERVTAQACRLRKEKAGDAPTVTFLGRHVPYKGVRVLLHALAQLPGVHAFIGGDGRARAENERLARRLGLAGRTHFLGTLGDEEKVPFFYAGDVFVLPSTNRTESFGQVQVEAQLCRRPVVTTDVGGAPEVTVDGRTGLVVPPDDAEALARALARLLKDRTLREHLGQAGYARARGEYVDTAVGPRLRRLFYDLEEALKT